MVLASRRVCPNHHRLRCKHCGAVIFSQWACLGPWYHRPIFNGTKSAFFSDRIAISVVLSLVASFAFVGLVALAVLSLQKRFAPTSSN
ncbi:hypothetical protein GQ457_01G031010 [Hibiscus cannabinus]